LNQAAHQALQLAEQAESMPVDAEPALEALAQLDLEVPDLESQEEFSALSMEAGQQEADNPVEPAGKESLLGRFSVMS
jgi:hypothetical protein